MIRPSTILLELSVIVIGFGIWGCVYGDWRMSETMEYLGMAGSETDRALLTLISIFLIIIYLVGTCLIINQTTNRFIRNMAKLYMIMQGPLSLAFVYFTMGFRQFFIFLIGVILGVLAILISKFEARAGMN